MRARAISASGSTGPPENTSARRRLRLDPALERVDQLLAARPVEHQPEGAFVVVLDHVDDGAVEVGVVEHGVATSSRPCVGGRRRARRDSTAL